VGLLHGPLDLCRVVAKQNACIVGPGILNSPIECKTDIVFSRPGKQLIVGH